MSTVLRIGTERCSPAHVQLANPGKNGTTLPPSDPRGCRGDSGWKWNVCTEALFARIPRPDEALQGPDQQRSQG